MRMKSQARDRKHANVDGNGIAPRAREAIAATDHHLLGDEVLRRNAPETLFSNLSLNVEFLDVRIEGDDARSASPSLASATPYASRVATSSPSLYAGGATGFRRIHAARPRGRFGMSVVRIHARRRGNELLLELRERAIVLRLLERPAVASRPLPSTNETPLPLIVAPDHRRLPFVRLASASAVEDGGNVMTVDDDGVPSEGAPSAGDLSHVRAPTSSAALAEAIDVR